MPWSRATDRRGAVKPAVNLGSTPPTSWGTAASRGEPHRTLPRRRCLESMLVMLLGKKPQADSDRQGGGASGACEYQGTTPPHVAASRRHRRRRRYRHGLGSFGAPLLGMAREGPNVLHLLIGRRMGGAGIQPLLPVPEFGCRGVGVGNAAHPLGRLLDELLFAGACVLVQIHESDSSPLSGLSSASPRSACARRRDRWQCTSACATYNRTIRPPMPVCRATSSVCILSR